MKRPIYTQIIYTCLLLLAILPVFSAFNLTWKELVRLLLITLGLLYLYIKYYRRPLGAEISRPNDSTTQRPYDPTTQGLLLSVIYIFLVTQFDPATSAINSIIPQPSLNWFFLASSALIFIAFGAFLLQRFGVGRGGNPEPRTSNLEPGGESQGGVEPRTLNLELGFLDKFILILGTTVILLSVGSKLIFSSQLPSLNSFLGALKIGEYILLYFLITRAWSLIPAFVTSRVGRKDDLEPRTLSLEPNKPPTSNFEHMIIFPLTVLCLISLIGGYRVASGLGHYKLFNKYTAMKTWDKATEYYKKIIKLDLDSVNPHLRLGDLYKRQGMWEQAKKEYARAFTLSKGTREQVTFEEWNEAVDVYKEVVRLDPNDIQAHLQLVNAYKKGGKIDQVIGEYKEIIEIDPNWLNVYRELGQLYLKKGQLDEAVKAYKQATELQPGDIRYYLWLAYAYRRTGKLDEAIIQCKSVIQIDPGSVWAYWAYEELGHCYKAKGQLDEVVNAYKQATELQPGDVRSCLWLAYAYRRTGKLDEAIIQCKSVIQIDPGSVWAYWAYEELGHCYEAKGQLDEAIGAYEKALEIQPNNAEAYKNLVALQQKVFQTK